MGQQQQFGDTTLTKVFVGGLAWETQKDSLRDHFEKYGDILEAVIIFDKPTGRSKGYGFVTFKEEESAKKAFEDPAPVINGRRANCNLASLGARRAKSSPPATPTGPPHQPAGTRRVSNVLPAPWYYAAPAGAPPSPLPANNYTGVVPPYYAAAPYGYSHPYVPSLGSKYNAQKPSHCMPATGPYVQAQYYPATQGGIVATPNAMLPFYPPTPMYHHQMAAAAAPRIHPHLFAPSTTVAAAMPPPTAEQVAGCS